MDDITSKQKIHYTNTFLHHGANASGVDWVHEDRAILRHKIMSNVILNDYIFSQKTKKRSLLDIGCGYGAFYKYLIEQNIKVCYNGIDVVPEMIAEGRKQFPNANFNVIDFFDFSLENKYDYVVCNGVLTQKLDASISEMSKFSLKLITKMFEHCNKGIAFNLMTSKVNFMVDNLYYCNPLEMLCFCLNSLSSKVRLEHAYNLYEYTIFVYKEGE